MHHHLHNRRSIPSIHLVQHGELDAVPETGICIEKLDQLPHQFTKPPRPLKNSCTEYPRLFDLLAVMLDINLFRVDKGGNPEVIRESQRRRGKPAEAVDEIIALDREWVTRI